MRFIYCFLLALMCASQNFAYHASDDHNIAILHSYQHALDVHPFPMNRFIVENRKYFSDELKAKTEPDAMAGLSVSEKNELTWQALMFMREYFSSIKNIKHEAYTYLTMAQFLETSGAYPYEFKHRPHNNPNRWFHHYLIQSIENVAKISSKRHGRIYIWSHIHLALLHMDYANKFKNHDLRAQMKTYKKAYELLIKAKKANSTKTVNFYLAKLILINNCIPEGYDSISAKEFALKLLKDMVNDSPKRARESEENQGSNLLERQVEKEPLFPIKTSQPVYLNKKPKISYNEEVLAVEDEDSEEDSNEPINIMDSDNEEPANVSTEAPKEEQACAPVALEPVEGQRLGVNDNLPPKEASPKISNDESSSDSSDSSSSDSDSSSSEEDETPLDAEFKKAQRTQSFSADLKNAVLKKYPNLINPTKLEQDRACLIFYLHQELKYPQHKIAILMRDFGGGVGISSITAILRANKMIDGNRLRYLDKSDLDQEIFAVYQKLKENNQPHSFRRVSEESGYPVNMCVRSLRRSGIKAKPIAKRINDSLRLKIQARYQEKLPYFEQQKMSKRARHLELASEFGVKIHIIHGVFQSKKKN